MRSNPLIQKIIPDSWAGGPSFFKSETTNPSRFKSYRSIKASIKRAGLSAATQSSGLPHETCDLTCFCMKFVRPKSDKPILQKNLLVSFLPSNIEQSDAVFLYSAFSVNCFFEPLIQRFNHD